MRFISSVCVFAASLLISFANAGIGYADTGESDGAETETATVASKSDDNGSGSRTDGASNAEPPSSTVGNGREDVGVQTKAEAKKNSGTNPKTKIYKGSLVIPYFRIPRQKELPPGGLPDPSLFYGTIVIPVPTLGDVLAAMQPKRPALVPGPSLKTQAKEAPPVVDSIGGGDGGVDPLTTGYSAEPPVLKAPLVIAPLPIPLSAPPPPAAAAGVPPAPVAAAGAPVPAIRGALPPPPEPVAKAVTPMSGHTMAPQPTRLGYPRELRSPTSAELTMLALPGVAGLLLLTISGGVIGYRQANSARLLRAQPAARFLR
jgi:hypothetical protein